MALLPLLQFRHSRGRGSRTAEEGKLTAEAEAEEGKLMVRRACWLYVRYLFGSGGAVGQTHTRYDARRERRHPPSGARSRAGLRDTARPALRLRRRSAAASSSVPACRGLPVFRIWGVGHCDAAAAAKKRKAEGAAGPPKERPS